MTINNGDSSTVSSSRLQRSAVATDSAKSSAKSSSANVLPSLADQVSIGGYAQILDGASGGASKTEALRQLYASGQYQVDSNQVANAFLNTVLAGG